MAFADDALQLAPNAHAVRRNASRMLDAAVKLELASPSLLVDWIARVHDVQRDGERVEQPDGASLQLSGDLLEVVRVESTAAGCPGGDDERGQRVVRRGDGRYVLSRCGILGSFDIHICCPHVMGETDIGVSLVHRASGHKTHIDRPLDQVALHRHGHRVFLQHTWFGERTSEVLDAATGAVTEHPPPARDEVLLVAEAFGRRELRPLSSEPELLTEDATDGVPITPFVFAGERPDTLGQTERLQRLESYLARWTERGTNADWLLLLGLFCSWPASGVQEGIALIRETVRRAAPEKRPNPRWLEWRTPDPAWELVGNVHIRIDGTTGDRTGDAVAASLRAASHLPPIYSLHLSYVGLSIHGVRDLLAAPGSGEIRELVLRRNPLGSAACRELLHSGKLRGLESLDLSETALDDGAAAAIASCADLRSLDVLTLDGNRIGDLGAQALAGSSVLRLRLLALNRNPIGPEGIAALLRSPALAKDGLRQSRLTGLQLSELRQRL